MVNLYDLSLAELTEFLAGLGERPYRARQLYAWLYGKGVNDFELMTDISGTVKEKLAAEARTGGLVLAETLKSKDGQTTKYLFGLEDEGYIETVFMKYKDRNSVCISTQAGCRMGCSFCASGADGLMRNLSPSEMALQVILSEREAGALTKNIVLMGVGEPLDNYGSVKKFIENITDDHGRDLSRRAITLSTCGLVPGIEKMARELPQVNLAVSLHAPNDALRAKIMPITKKYGVTEVVDATRKHYEKTRRRPTFEYALIDGFNDSADHARDLASLLKGMNCLVNLIPLNKHDGKEHNRDGSFYVREQQHNGDGSFYVHEQQHNGDGSFYVREQQHNGDGSSYVRARTQLEPSPLCLRSGSPAERAEQFREELGRRHVPATVRKSLGEDIEAACGQLRLRRK